MSSFLYFMYCINPSLNQTHLPIYSAHLPQSQMFLVEKKHQPHIWSCPQFLSTSFRWAFFNIQEPHCFSHTERRVSFLSLLKPPDAPPFQRSGTHLIFSSEKGVAINWEIPELPSSTLAECLLSFSPSLPSPSYREKVPPSLKKYQTLLSSIPIFEKFKPTITLKFSFSP